LCIPVDAQATARFYAQIYQSINRHFDFDQLKVIIIASPGFVKEGVQQAIFEEAQRTNNKAILTAKPRFLLLHASSHHVHSLTAVLSSPEVSSQLKDTKFAREGMALARCARILRSLREADGPTSFHKMLGQDELRAWYGEGHVLKAIERGAVSTLLISDALFK
jgi:protein pelota